MTEKAVEWFQQDTVFVTPHCTQTNLEFSSKQKQSTRNCTKAGDVADLLSKLTG